MLYGMLWTSILIFTKWHCHPTVHTDILMLDRNVAPVNSKALSKCTKLLINEALNDASITKKITSTKIRKSTAKCTKSLDVTQEERRQRLYIQQTHSSATHSLSYEGLDNREQAPIVSKEILELNQWNSPDVWFNCSSAVVSVIND